jgi:hypothetical protein
MYNNWNVTKHLQYSVGRWARVSEVVAACKLAKKLDVSVVGNLHTVKTAIASLGNDWDSENVFVGINVRFPMILTSKGSDAYIDLSQEPMKSACNAIDLATDKGGASSGTASNRSKTSEGGKNGDNEGTPDGIKSYSLRQNLANLYDYALDPINMWDRGSFEAATGLIWVD